MFRTWTTGGRMLAGAVALVIVGGMTMSDAVAGSAAIPRKPVAVVVQAEAAAGFAAAGNSSPADVLVLVTDRVAGTAITDLAKTDFVVINHFSRPGQTCGFSNNIVTFNNVGTGAYHLQVAPVGCSWAPGVSLLQVIVSSLGRNGQAAAKFTIER